MRGSCFLFYHYERRTNYDLGVKIPLLRGKAMCLCYRSGGQTPRGEKTILSLVTTRSPGLGMRGGRIEGMSKQKHVVTNHPQAERIATAKAASIATTAPASTTTKDAGSSYPQPIGDVESNPDRICMTASYTGGIVQSLEIVVELVVDLEIVTLDAHLEMRDGFRSLGSGLRCLAIAIHLTLLTLMVQAGLGEADEEKVLSVDHRVVETNYGLSSPNPLLMVPFTLIKGADAKGAVCLDGTFPDYHLHPGIGSGANSWLIQFETFTIGTGSSFAIAMIDVSGKRTMRNLYAGVVKLQLQESLTPRAADPNNDWHDCKVNHARCKVSQIRFLQERGPISR
ncbi:hypothetical protein Syun_003621 [Stephania yunnanensis]|uniref:Pectin acetylesterase n=1 Tax=Stephania yunnanensis TaxID=152371 RepID=A0AAP0L5F3_9MAGN